MLNNNATTTETDRNKYVDIQKRDDKLRQNTKFFRVHICN